MQPPFLPPPILPVRNRRYTYGAFDLYDGRWAYVNRGLGYLRRDAIQRAAGNNPLHARPRRGVTKAHVITHPVAGRA